MTKRLSLEQKISDLLKEHPLLLSSFHNGKYTVIYNFHTTKSKSIPRAISELYKLMK